MTKLRLAFLAAQLVVCEPALAQAGGIELWRGLREGMTSGEVLQVLSANADIRSVEARKTENEFGDDFKISYKNKGIVIAEIPFNLRINMDQGRLRSVALYPLFVGVASCLSEGRERLDMFDGLLGEKYTKVDQAVPTVFGVRADYFQRIYQQDRLYVINRLFVQSHDARTFSGSVALRRCAFDNGTTGAQSLLYVSKSYVDAQIRTEFEAADKAVKREVDKL